MPFSLIEQSYTNQEIRFFKNGNELEVAMWTLHSKVEVDQC